MAGLGHEVLDWLNTGTGIFASTSAAALLAYSTYTLVHTHKGPSVDEDDDDYLDDFIEVLFSSLFGAHCSLAAFGAR